MRILMLLFIVGMAIGRDNIPFITLIVINKELEDGRAAQKFTEGLKASFVPFNNSEKLFFNVIGPFDRMKAAEREPPEDFGMEIYLVTKKEDEAIINDPCRFVLNTAVDGDTDGRETFKRIVSTRFHVTDFDPTKETIEKILEVYSDEVNACVSKNSKRAKRGESAKSPGIFSRMGRFFGGSKKTSDESKAPNNEPPKVEKASEKKAEENPKAAEARGEGNRAEEINKELEAIGLQLEEVKNKIQDGEKQSRIELNKKKEQLEDMKGKLDEEEHELEVRMRSGGSGSDVDPELVLKVQKRADDIRERLKTSEAGEQEPKKKKNRFRLPSLRGTKSQVPGGAERGNEETGEEGSGGQTGRKRGSLGLGKKKGESSKGKERGGKTSFWRRLTRKDREKKRLDEVLSGGGRGL